MEWKYNRRTPDLSDVGFCCLHLSYSLHLFLFFSLLDLSLLLSSIFGLLFRVCSSVCEEQRKTLSGGRWRGLLRVSVIFGCDISIAGLNVWCQPIYYLVTGEKKTQAGYKERG